MKCIRCDSERILGIYGKCNDLFSAELQGKSYDGYPLQIPELTDGSSALSFRICLDCGQVVGIFPIPPCKLETDEEEEEYSYTQIIGAEFQKGIREQYSTKLRSLAKDPDMQQSIEQFLAQVTDEQWKSVDRLPDLVDLMRKWATHEE